MVETKRKTGLSDEVRVEDGSGDDLFADREVNIASASHDVEIPSELVASIGSGADFVARNDGQLSVTGDLSVRAIDLEVLELLGSYSDDGDTWTVEPQDQLPEWEFKQQVTEDDVLVLGGYDDSGSEPQVEEGFKFDEATFSVDVDGTVELDFSGVGLYAELQSDSIETNNSTLDPENWLDAHVEIDGTEVASLDSVEVTISRDAEAVRGIEQRDENFRLLPNQVVEGMRDITFSMTVEVTDETGWDEVFGDDTRPQDSRDEKDIKVHLSDEAGTLEVLDAVVETTSATLEDDAEVRTVDIDGNARSWKATGEV